MPKLLKKLNPKWAGITRAPEHGEGLALDCPSCGPSHQLAVYFKNPLDGGASFPGVSNWVRYGSSLEDLTVEPSLEYECFHGWIENGLVFYLSESPLIVPMNLDGKVKLVSLSPAQARSLCEETLARIKEITTIPEVK
jgi:hypothetical protein